MFLSKSYREEIKEEIMNSDEIRNLIDKVESLERIVSVQQWALEYKDDCDLYTIINNLKNIQKDSNIESVYINKKLMEYYYRQFFKLNDEGKISSSDLMYKTESPRCYYFEGIKETDNIPIVVKSDVRYVFKVKTTTKQSNSTTTSEIIFD